MIHLISITGEPRTGKSTLAAALGSQKYPRAYLFDDDLAGLMLTERLRGPAEGPACLAGIPDGSTIIAAGDMTANHLRQWIPLFFDSFRETKIITDGQKSAGAFT